MKFIWGYGFGIPNLLEPKDGVVLFDRCITVWDEDCGVIDDVVVNLGLSGEVNVDLLVAVVIGDGLEAGVLRKTRAGGN